MSRVRRQLFLGLESWKTGEEGQQLEIRRK
jgi:hypothetical protein